MEGIVREFEIDMYTLLYLKWITNKVVFFFYFHGVHASVTANFFLKKFYVYICICITETQLYNVILVSGVLLKDLMFAYIMK